MAGEDLGDWLRKAVESRDELDYAEALDWYGLRFGAQGSAHGRWGLEVRPGATPAQRKHLEALLAPADGAGRAAAPEVSRRPRARAGRAGAPPPPNGARR